MRGSDWVTDKIPTVLYSRLLLTSASSPVPGADPIPNPKHHSHPEQQTWRTGASVEFPAMQNKSDFNWLQNPLFQ